MIAKIIIKRHFKEGHDRQIIALLNELRSLAMSQPGYISGETLTQIGYPNNLVVLASWQSMKNWHAWRDSKERQKFESMLDIYLEQPTEYEEYYLGVSGASRDSDES